jgi:hypothetical protein
MIAKLFIFQFVNSYASFFYLAFIAENTGDCPLSGCMPSLAINLAIIFGIRYLICVYVCFVFLFNNFRLATSIFFQLVIPYFLLQYQLQKVMKHHKDTITRPELEFLLFKVFFFFFPGAQCLIQIKV